MMRDLDELENDPEDDPRLELNLEILGREGVLVREECKSGRASCPFDQHVE